QDPDCVPGYFCDNLLCFPKRGVGEACTRDDNCANPTSTNPSDNGFCADGICCAQDCNSFDCKRCNLTGSTGQCTNAPDHSEPRSTTSCQGAYVCGAGGNCLTSCTPNVVGGTVSRDCRLGDQCVENQCGFPAANGSACTNNAGCASRICSEER